MWFELDTGADQSIVAKQVYLRLAPLPRLSPNGITITWNDKIESMYAECIEGALPITSCYTVNLHVFLMVYY